MTHSKNTGQHFLDLDEKALEEIKSIAESLVIDKAALSLPYKDFQLVLHLQALEVWLGSFGISAPYSLRLGKDEQQ